MVGITHHGFQRCRKRFGLAKNEIPSAVEAAFHNGLINTDFRGRFKGYLDRLASSKPGHFSVRVHKFNIYIFSNELLITAWSVPPEFNYVMRKIEAWHT